MRPAWNVFDSPGQLFFENSCYASPCHIMWVLWSEIKEFETTYLSVLKISTPQNLMSETKPCTLQKWQICFKVHITLRAFIIIRSFGLFGFYLLHFIHFLYHPLRLDYKILEGRCVCFITYLHLAGLWELYRCERGVIWYRTWEIKHHYQIPFFNCDKGN